MENIKRVDAHDERDFLVNSDDRRMMNDATMLSSTFFSSLAFI